MFFNQSQIKGGRKQHQEPDGHMPEGETGMVMRRMRMMKMGEGELGIAGTEAVDEDELEMKPVILIWNLQKPGRIRQIRNPRKMMKKRKMRKGVKAGKVKMRRKGTKSLIKKGKKRRPTRRKRTKRNQDQGN